MGVVDWDELYGLALDRFTTERQALARTLRSEGKREEAARVTALRKPSVAAWAVNQLVRTQRKDLTELFKAGDAARRAQADLIEGRGDARTLREAAHRQRGAVDTLIEAARGLLSSQGHELSTVTLERVADTLHAAALDEDARAAVGEGRLERELRHVGMVGGAQAVSAPTGTRDPVVPKATGRTAKAQPSTSREEREAAKRAQRERQEARRTARAAEADARRRSERAARAVNAAEERRDRAAEALEQAEQELADARAEAQAAAEDHGQAKAALEQQ